MGHFQRYRSLTIVTGGMGETIPHGQGHNVKVFCKSTKGNAEFHCGVCGQGFVLFWERQPRTERVAILSEIQETMRRHHRTSHGPDAHPQGGFLAPEWGDPSELAAAAFKGGNQVPDL